MLDAADAVPGPHAVVFMYHRVGDTRYPSTDISVSAFKDELDHLAAGNFHVWPLAKIVQALSDGEGLPDRTVAITVDDAYQSFYQNAYPLLRARGWPFTVFVSTDAIDRNLPDFMSWEEMREMAEHGATFANHTATHMHLVNRLPGETDEVWAHRVEADILKAQSRLHAQLGKSVNEQPRLFAYPYGEYDRQLAAVVTRLGFVAFGQESGAIGPIEDRRALPRYPIAQAFSDIRQFMLKATSLPLSPSSIQPWNPVIKRGEIPSLVLGLRPDSGILREQLACYGADGERLKVEWLDADHTRLRVYGSAIDSRRSRSNCTAPDSSEPDRYHWYSHPWFLFD